MALEHLILDPDESANLWRDCGDKRSYALWGLIPFKNKEVLFLQLEKLPIGVATNAAVRNAVQCSTAAEILQRAPQKQLLSLLNPSPDSGIRVPRSSVSVPTTVSLWNMHLNWENWSAPLLLDNWSSKGNLNMITQLLEMPLNAASVRDLWRYQRYLYPEMHIRTWFSQSSEN